jgi:uncharacterized Tic20 family protein
MEEDSNLTYRVRTIAAMCHLAGLMWLPISIAIANLVNVLIPPITDSDRQNLFFGLLFVMPIIGMMLATLLTFTLWKTNRQKYSFIDRSGCVVVNFIFSCCAYLTISFLLMGSSYLLAYSLNLSALLTISMPLMGLYIILCPILLLGHLILSISGAIFALQGKIYSYPLTLQIIKN